MRHTEGPWKYDTKHTTGPWTINAGHGETVITANGRDVVRISDRPNIRTPDLADINLIAAAPDLLAVMRDILALAQTCGECSGSGEDQDGDVCRGCAGFGEVCQCCSELAALRAAIARAEGTD